MTITCDDVAAALRDLDRFASSLTVRSLAEDGLTLDSLCLEYMILSVAAGENQEAPWLYLLAAEGDELRAVEHHAAVLVEDTRRRLLAEPLTGPR